MVEVEGTDAEGQVVKAALASLKPSSLPSVSEDPRRHHHKEQYLANAHKECIHIKFEYINKKQDISLIKSLENIPWVLNTFSTYLVSLLYINILMKT